MRTKSPLGWAGFVLSILMLFFILMVTFILIKSYQENQREPKSRFYYYCITEFKYCDTTKYKLDYREEIYSEFGPGMVDSIIKLDGSIKYRIVGNYGIILKESDDKIEITNLTKITREEYEHQR